MHRRCGLCSPVSSDMSRLPESQSPQSPKDFALHLRHRAAQAAEASVQHAGLSERYLELSRQLAALAERAATSSVPELQTALTSLEARCRMQAPRPQCAQQLSAKQGRAPRPNCRQTLHQQSVTSRPRQSPPLNLNQRRSTRSHTQRQTSLLLHRLHHLSIRHPRTLNQRRQIQRRQKNQVLRLPPTRRTPRNRYRFPRVLPRGRGLDDHEHCRHDHSSNASAQFVWRLRAVSESTPARTT